MDRSVSQALSTLLPALTGPLPPELIELAVSLLAQSRSKASTLKAEEEIARAYACANIACERLKHTLALPKIQPRPPCAPKAYQNLYKYLDGVLPRGTRKSARATGSTYSPATPISSPVKPRTPARVANLKSKTSERKSRRRVTNAPEVPAWVMPVVRQLCQKMSAPTAPHHIFAGVASILSSSDSDTENELNISALIVALFLLVTTRLAGVRTQPAEYTRQKRLALEVLKESAGEDTERKNVDDADVIECTKQFKDQHWIEMDWFGNIPMGSGLDMTEGPKEIGDDVSRDDEAEETLLLPVEMTGARRLDSADQDYLQAGLATMMQDRVDYISDDRRHDYQEWKKNILLQIDELERMDEMDLEAG